MFRRLFISPTVHRRFTGDMVVDRVGVVRDFSGLERKNLPARGGQRLAVGPNVPRRSDRGGVFRQEVAIGDSTSAPHRVYTGNMERKD